MKLVQLTYAPTTPDRLGALIGLTDTGRVFYLADGAEDWGEIQTPKDTRRDAAKTEATD